MAIKVYKGGSWVNATGVSAIGKADRLAIGQTDTSLATSDKNYYLSFVDENHSHTDRKYEDFYTGIGITYSPISRSLGVGGVLYLSGTCNNFQGSIRSYGGADKLFVLYNESSEGIISINPANSAGDTVGLVTFKSSTADGNKSYFKSDVSPTIDCTGIFDLGKADKKWNKVYANCFIGNGSGLDGTGHWDEDVYKNLKAGTYAGNAITAQTCYNIFVGAYAGCKTTGAGGAGGSDEVGDANVFLGASAGRHNITGSYNFYGGYLAGRGKIDSSPSGCCNIFIGRSAGQEITSGKQNVFLGPLAGEAMETGDNNIFLGLSAGRYASSASYTIGIGLGAGLCNTSANGNTFLGAYAGRGVTSGGNNVAIGSNALRGRLVTVGDTEVSCDILGIQNTAIGFKAGFCLGPLAVDQGANTFLGAQAACTQLDGSFNVAIGYQVELDLKTCANASCVSNQLAIGAGSNRWLTGDKSFNIKPGRGIIDCAGSSGGSAQVLTAIEDGGASYVKWETNSAVATNADKVGIGTTDNANGDDVQSYYVSFVRDNNAHNSRQYEQLYSDSKLVYNYKASNDTSTFGIGTNNPQSPLHIQNSGPQLQWTDSDDNSDSKIRYNSPNFIIEADSNNEAEDSNISFRIDGSLVHPNEKLRITSAGHVGIGTTNPIADDAIIGKTIKDYLEDNNSVLAVGIVTARDYYGNFKGTIDSTIDKIVEKDTSAEVVDVGLTTHFTIKTDGIQRLRIDDAGISTFSSDKALVARFERIGNTDGKWAKVDIKANTTDGNSYLTFSDSGATEVGAINYEHNDDTLRFEVLDVNNADPLKKVRRSRLQVGNAGQIGLWGGYTPDGSGISDSYGTDGQVLTSKGSSAAAIWQDASDLPASTATTLTIGTDDNAGDRYLTFVAASGDTQNVYMDSELKYNPNTDTLTSGNITSPNVSVSTLLNVEGNTTLGNSASEDTITFTGKVNSSVLPKTNADNKDDVSGLDLGGGSAYWRNIYARQFTGSLSGDSTSAQALDIGTDNNANDRYLTFVAGSGDSKDVYMDSELKYNSSTDTLTPVNLTVTGNTTLGNTNADTTTFTSKVASHIIPVLEEDNETGVSEWNLGELGAKWGTVFANEFNGSFSGSIEKINTASSENENTTYLTFTTTTPTDTDRGSFLLVNPHLKFRSNSADDGEKLTVDCQLDVTGTATLNGNVTLGGAATDTATFNSKVASHIFPSHNASASDDADGKDLGDGSNYWRKVYAKEYTGKFIGTLESRKIAMTGDVAWEVNFDASGDVTADGTIQPGAVDESMINITNAPSASTAGYFLQTNASGSLTWAQVAAGDGVNLNFVDLEDTPSAYTDNANKLVAVNGNADALIFTDASSVGTDSYVTGASWSNITGGRRLTLTRNQSLVDITADLTLSSLGGASNFLDLTDTPESYGTTNAGGLGKVVAINSTNDGLEFVSRTYTLPTFGNANGSSGIRLSLGGTNNDDVNITGANGITVKGNSSGGNNTLTIGCEDGFSSNKVNITLKSDNATYYPTFVSGNTAEGKEVHQDSDGLTYNPHANLLTTGTLMTGVLDATGAASLNGNVTLGDAAADTVTFNAKSTTIIPSGDSGTQNLGSENNKWGTVYADNITGTLTVPTAEHQVLYTGLSGTNPIVAGTNEFTFITEPNSKEKAVNILKISHLTSPDDRGEVFAYGGNDVNYASISGDGGIEICRGTSDTGLEDGGAYIDFKDSSEGENYDARIQLTKQGLGADWDAGDNYGILFETGGIGKRHMLLTEEGTLGITTSNVGAGAIVKKASRTIGFAPGYSRDTASFIDGAVALDVNGTALLRRHDNVKQGGQITFCNSDDTVAYSIDVKGTTAANSVLRIIDEKTLADNDTRGTQRYVINRSGAFGIGDEGAADYGENGQFLKSTGDDSQPVWDAISTIDSYVTGASFSNITDGKRLTLNRNQGLTNITADFTFPNLARGMYFKHWTNGTNTWKPKTGSPADYDQFLVICIGGGGGSGRAEGQDDDGCDGSTTGGGGGGGCAISYFNQSSLSGNYSVVVGGGGAAGKAGSNGQSGGQSKVTGTNMTVKANGGGGSSNTGIGQRSAGGSGGTISNGTLKFTGMPGGRSDAAGAGGSAGGLGGSNYGKGGAGRSVCNQSTNGNAGNKGVVIILGW